MKTWIYPISIPFTEDIFKLLWNFLLVITNNDKRSSINTLILEDITDRCRSFIFGGETVMQMFLREILQELKGVMCVLLLQCCVLLVIFEEKIAWFVVFFVIHVRIEIHEIKLTIEFVLLQWVTEENIKSMRLLKLSFTHCSLWTVHGLEGYFIQC